ncbi:MAG: VWA domain-containing protein, partial [Oscillospiraceae bacterium]|nr:VWA domain-containing protein [Oscillospiraceae bacterium]
MRMRRLLAVLLLLSMLVSVVPTSVFAVETENGSDGETAATAVDPSTAPSDNLFVDKTVKLEADGTYTIDLSAYATGTPITKTVALGVPLDVVLVVDQSGSMATGEYGAGLDDLKSAVHSFVKALYKNGESHNINHRISICGFASSGEAGMIAGEKVSCAGTTQDFAWVNTGLFVNGEFKNYGKLTCTKVTSAEDIKQDQLYAIELDGYFDGVIKKFPLTYIDKEGAWFYNTGDSNVNDAAEPEKDADGKVIKTAEEVLFEKYKGKLYHMSSSDTWLTADDYQNAWTNISNNPDGTGGVNEKIESAIGQFSGCGATRTMYGLRMARELLENGAVKDDGRKKVVVVFTDGAPGTSGYTKGDGDAALAEAGYIKETLGAEIYGIALAQTPEDAYTTFMTQMSSNYCAPKFEPITNDTDKFDTSKITNKATNKFARVTFSSRHIGYYGYTPYFYKDTDGNYWPVVYRYELYRSRNTYYVGYTNDNGDQWLVSGPNKDINDLVNGVNGAESPFGTLYMLAEPDKNLEAKTDYFLHADSDDKLLETFDTIAKELTIYTTSVTLDTTAILQDVLAEGFTFTDNTKITVSVVPGSVSEDSGLTPEELTADKITWSEEAQQVLTMNARAQTAESEPFVVTGAFDQTEMTLTATAENGEINVTGYNYAVQFIGKDHVGSKLVVTVTGVEAVTGVTTNAATSTNKATSGVYEGLESDADKDGIPGEIETPFPVPNTYLTSEYYYLNENNTVTIDPKDFLMDEGINISDGYHFFNTAEPGTTLETDYGTVTVNGDGTVTYTLNEGVELEKDIICLFGKTEDATVKAATANANGNMWSEITILPPLDAVGKLHTDKSATLMGDGTYTIDLEAFATGTPAITALAKGVPLDVVLVLDQSASLAYRTVNGESVKDGAALAALKASVSSFVHELQANGDANGLNHRISICGFGSDVYWSRAANDELWNLTYIGGKKTYIYTNTGLFVNGEFRNYGKVEYTKIDIDVNNLDDANELAKIVDYKGYWAKRKDGNGPDEMLQYYPNTTTMRKWITSGWNAFIDRDNKADVLRECLEIYDLYEIGTEFTYLSPEQYKNSWQNVSDGQGNLNPNVAKAIDSLAANGGTYTSYGLRMARHMLANNPLKDDTEREKVVIVFTDGKAGGNNDSAGEMSAALAEAKKIKGDNVEIYAIGVYNESTAKSVENFMNQLSSNCNSHTFSKVTTASLDYSNPKSAANGYDQKTQPYFYYEAGTGNYYPIKVYWANKTTEYTWYYITDKGEKRITDIEVGATEISDVYKLDSGAHDTYLGYYSNSNDFNDMPGLFREIVTEVSTYSSEVQLDAKAILKDVMADGFTLTNNTQITVSVVPGSVKEGFADVGAKRLGSEHIAWGTPQKVLTFKYSEAKEGTGNVIVNGAADQTEMTLSAQVTEDGIITVTGFNYAAALDNHKENAQYICAGHPGSKLVVTITGVEAKNGVTTDSFTVTNKGTSGIYEASDSDMDGDGVPNELQAYFPIPTTYLSSKTYYVDYSGELIIDPADFLMTIKGYSLDKNGYHGFGAPDTTIELDHGTVTVLDDGKLKFTMKSDGLGITDTFYLFGHTDNTTVKAAMANTTGNMWSKVTIITPEDITGKLFLDKEATLTGDGTYTIDLNAYATGTPASTIIQDGIPLDVVLVIDQSGSLAKNHIHDDLKNAVSAFVEELKVHGEAYGIRHRVSMAGFAGGGLDEGSGMVGGGYPVANDPEDGVFYPHWLNTGLFVNGEFKNYGTVEYDRIDSVSEIGDTNQRLVFEFDYGNDGIQDRWVTFALNCLMANKPFLDETGTHQSNPEELAGSVDLLFEKYPLYRAGGVRATLTDDDYTAAWEYVADGENGSGNLNQDITRAISRIGSNGSTRISYGMKMASKLVEKAPDDHIERKTIVVVFTDGMPGHIFYEKGEAQAAVAEAKKIKEKSGVEIYSIGVYANQSTANQAQDIMSQLSSNYSSHQFSMTSTVDIDTDPDTRFDKNMLGVYAAISPYFHKDADGNYWPVRIYYNDTKGLLKFFYRTDEGEVVLRDYSSNMTYDGLYILEHTQSTDPNADYYRYTLNAAELKGMFKDIITDATTIYSEVTLDASSILKDVMADGFTLTGNTTVTVSVVPGSVKKEYANLTADELTSDKITWGEPQQVLTFAYPAETEKSGSVVVNGAADRTEMTLNAKVTEDGIITVDGFNYAGPTDPFCIAAQYIRAGHAGSKLVVTVTGVEAKTDVVTDSVTTTNKGTSGIYESEDSDMDGDGDKHEMQASFPIPTTYLTSEFYYLDENNSVTFNPKDFLMTDGGVNADPDGYNFFNVNTPGTTVNTEHGTITVNANETITYQLVGDWEGKDIFYLFGKTDDPTVTGTTANDNGNMWSKITILPPKDVGGKLNTDKEATLESNGTYTIDLEAFATGTPVSTIIQEGVPLDVVLVIDQSASMAKGSAGATMKETQVVVENFVKALYENGESFGINHRISMCGFACEGMEGTVHC